MTRRQGLVDIEIRGSRDPALRDKLLGLDDVHDVSWNSSFRSLISVREIGLLFWGAFATVVFGTELIVTLSAVGGYLGKKMVDLVADVIRDHLKEKKDERTVKILGPDGKVLRIVKAADHE